VLLCVLGRVTAAHGGFVSNTASYQSITVTNYDCSGASVALDETTTAPVGISFYSANNTFAYSWNTGTSSASCRSVVIRLRDGLSRELLFRMQ